MPVAAQVKLAVPFSSVNELPIEMLEPFESKKNSTETPSSNDKSAMSLTIADI